MQLAVSGGVAGLRFGSGYLVSGSLVITAGHVVSGARQLTVRFVEGPGRVRNAPGTVAWSDPDVDLAVLRLPEPVPGVAPASFGQLIEPAACEAVGFPRFKLLAAREPDDSAGPVMFRDSHHARGSCSPLSNRRAGTLEVLVDPPERDADPQRSPWEGMSGAALFAGGTLIAVICEHHRREGFNRLTARPVARWYSLLGAQRLVELRELLGLPDADALVPVGPAVSQGRSNQQIPSGIHNLPDLPSTVFVGRGSALTELKAAVNKGPTTITQSITGLGGIGKTTVALHYAHAHLGHYTATWWIDASSRSSLEAGLTSLAERLVPETRRDWTTAHGAAAWATAWLQTHPGWLLILDNADRPETVTTTLGALRDHGQIIITSRYSDFPTTIPLPLAPLARSESMRLLAQRSTFPTSGDSATPTAAASAHAIAEALGDLPLALEHAAAYIRTTRTSYADYLTLLGQDLAAVLNRAPRDDPKSAVSRTWTVTVNAISESSWLAVRILNMAAWYDADNIPRALFSGFGGSDRTSVPEALAALHTYSMINLNEHYFSVHRLVQAVLRSEQHGEPVEDLGVPITQRIQAYDLLARALSIRKTTAMPELWSAWRTLSAHTRAAQTYTDSKDAPSIAPYVNAAAILLYEHGQLDIAVSFFESCLAEYERVLGVDSKNAISSRINVAAAYHAAGDLERAIALYEANMAICDQALGPDHSATLTTRSNLAHAYQSAGRLNHAITMFEMALLDHERQFGSDHPDTMICRNNLASAYAEKGDFNQAILLHSKNYEARERVLGPDHRDTLLSGAHLALAYKGRGDVGRAIPLLEKNLTDRERVLGSDHPDTLSSRNNLATAYKSIGDLGRAITLLEATLVDCERVLGLDHPETMTCRNNLASTYGDNASRSQEIQLLTLNLAERERVLGPDHPDTFLSRHNLACAYADNGDLRGAIALFEATLSDCERVLDPDHSLIQLIRNNLASAKQRSDRSA